MKTRAKVIVSGKVQGVCYRHFTTEEARRLGLCGWVRNLHDGRVEALIEGEQEPVELLLEFMRKGPRHALVHEMELSYQEFKGDYSEFTVSYD